MNSYQDTFHPLKLIYWHNWLKDNYKKSTGVWLVTYKKHTGKPRVEYEEAVEEALCFGWIDSTRRKLDDERGMLRFSPRKPKSMWAGTNKARVEKLTAEGRMTDYALERVEVAKKDGSWNFLNDIEAMIIPDDLEKKFDNYKHARSNFQIFPDGIKKSILAWIKQAKTEKTRTKRIQETALLAEDNIRAHQWKKKGE
jgi:uncharacterized protein YdeI (YjbR/CyaY-like superfamily)